MKTASKTGDGPDGHVVNEPAFDFLRSEVDHLLKLQGARIRDARVKAGRTIEDVAMLSGLHFNTVGRIERGQSEASAEQVLRIARVLDVPPVSLSLYGGQPVVSTDNEEFVLIDVVDVEVSAGGGALNGHHEVLGRMAFQRSWLQQHKLSPSNARIITARGKSMADRINHGDILLVDTSVNTLKEDGVYVIERDGLDYVKLLQRDFSTGGLHIISYNPDFKPQFLTAEQSSEMRICGRVVWHGGEL